METPRLALSIISPVYQAEGIVTELVRRITEAARQITESFEIVLVEDRGPDESWAKIVELAKGKRATKSTASNERAAGGPQSAERTP